MKNLKIYLAIFIAMVFYFNATAQSVDEIIAKHLETSGGLENLQAIKTMKVIGSVKMMGMEMPYTSTTMVPFKNYFELSVQGKAIKQAYDGTIGWMVNPMAGAVTPEKVDDEMANTFKERGRIIDKLITYKDDNAKVELAGTEKVNNVDVHQLKYTSSTGDVTNYFISSDNYMIVKIKKVLKIMGQEMDSETSYYNFKKIGEVTMAYGFDVKTKNAAMGTQEITIDKIELNPTVDENIFTMPAK
jgi:hypothetical protein